LSTQFVHKAYRSGSKSNCRTCNIFCNECVF